MQIATSHFGDPFVLIPRSHAEAWEDAILEELDELEPLGPLGEITLGESYMHIILFRGIEVIQIGEGNGGIYWFPAEGGGMLLEILGADSSDDLEEFGLAVVNRNVWEESLEVEIPEADVRVMAALGVEGDGLQRIDLNISPGLYRIEASYAKDLTTMAVVFRIAKIGGANKSP